MPFQVDITSGYKYPDKYTTGKYQNGKPKYICSNLEPFFGIFSYFSHGTTLFLALITILAKTTMLFYENCPMPLPVLLSAIFPSAASPDDQPGRLDNLHDLIFFEQLIKALVLRIML